MYKDFSLDYDKVQSLTVINQRLLSKTPFITIITWLYLRQRVLIICDLVPRLAVDCSFSKGFALTVRMTNVDKIRFMITDLYHKLVNKLTQKKEKENPNGITAYVFGTKRIESEREGKRVIELIFLF